MAVPMAAVCTTRGQRLVPAGSLVRRHGGSPELSEVLRDAHPLGVEPPQLPRLDMAQLRPASEQGRNELFATRDLAREISGIERREIVWKLFHVRSVPSGVRS